MEVRLGTSHTNPNLVLVLHNPQIPNLPQRLEDGIVKLDDAPERLDGLFQLGLATWHLELGRVGRKGRGRGLEGIDELEVSTNAVGEEKVHDVLVGTLEGFEGFGRTKG